MDHDKLDKLRGDVDGLQTAVQEVRRWLQYLDGEIKRLSSNDSRREASLISIREMIEHRDQH